MNEQACRKVVTDRAQGVCEAHIPGVCERKPTNMAHRKARSQGGRWTPSNVLHLCGSGTTGCHGWAHSHPEEAHTLGLMCKRHETPGEEPVLHAWHGWVLLHDSGDVIPVDVFVGDDDED